MFLRGYRFFNSYFYAKPADAEPNKTYFAKYGLIQQFFASLQKNVTAFREITHGQADAKQTRVGATADIESILQDALDKRAELKIAIENHYKDNPQKLAEWLTASHIKRRGETEQKPETPVEETPSN